MRTLGVFNLFFRLGDATTPARASIAAAGEILPSEHEEGGGAGMRLTPECTSFEELEGYINALQDELDTLRMRARKAFSRD